MVLLKNGVTGVGGGGGEVPKVKDKNWHWGGGIQANSDINTKKNMHKFLFFACFWSARQLGFG